MARRLSWSRCSYKRITLVVCCVNLIAAFFVFRSLFGFHPSWLSSKRWSWAQARRIEESVMVRKALESADLVNAVAKLRKELDLEEKMRPKLPQTMKQQLAFEIVQRFNNFSDSKNVTEQQAIMELWHAEKLEEIKRTSSSKLVSNSSSDYREAEMLKQALESNWFALMEDIGLWMPTGAINTEHNDKPESEQAYEDYIIPGRPLPPECHAELHTDYGGAAVRWGLTHHKESAADCCQACLNQAKRAKPGQLKCNIWVYCPSEKGCYSPDIYEHKHQECWLKQADVPSLNFKGTYSDTYRSNNPTAPEVVPWISGVISTS